MCILHLWDISIQTSHMSSAQQPHMASSHYTGQLSSNSLNSTAPPGLTSTVLCPKPNTTFRPILSPELQALASCLLVISTCLTEIFISSPKLHSLFTPQNLSLQPTPIQSMAIPSIQLLELKSKESSFSFTSAPYPNSQQILSIQPIDVSIHLPPFPLLPP